MMKERIREARESIQLQVEKENLDPQASGALGIDCSLGKEGTCLFR